MLGAINMKADFPITVWIQHRDSFSGDDGAIGHAAVGVFHDDQFCVFGHISELRIIGDDDKPQLCRIYLCWQSDRKSVV